MEYNILIVDDSAITRSMIKKIIGMVRELDVTEIFEADTGAAALERLSEHCIDLVLADLNMPEMDGIEMITHMRESESTKSIPVVIVSTESSVTRIDELLNTEGVKGYLHKPFTPEEFREAITNVVGELV